MLLLANPVFLGYDEDEMSLCKKQAGAWCRVSASNEKLFILSTVSLIFSYPLPVN